MNSLAWYYFEFKTKIGINYWMDVEIVEKGFPQWKTTYFHLFYLFIYL